MGVLGKTGIVLSAFFLLASVGFAEDKDLSKDATYVFSQSDGNTLTEANKVRASVEDIKLSAGKDFLLKGEAPANQVCAFKTKNIFSKGAKGVFNPYIDITLARNSAIKKIYIENNLKEPELSKGLTVWISKDGETWKRVWDAPATVEKDYTILFAKPEEGKYVRIGIEWRAFLSLNKVRIYGN